MRFLRASLLLLLIALLPIRGSFAAALLCEDTTAHSHAESIGHMRGHDSRHALASHDMSAHAAEHQLVPGAADKCNLCSGLTTPAYPVEALAGLGRGLSSVKVRPQPTVWPASFVSAGLERPPRST